ncbi:MAG TPA: AMP-binding protein [Acidimicrobiales bacterium]
MDLQFANAWEIVADVVPEHAAIVQGERRYSYRAFDDLSSRFASALGAAGVSEGSAIGLYLYNSPEFLIAQAGSFKHRAVPINVNFRYLDDELAYLIDNADAEVIVFHTSLGERVANVRERLPKLKLLVEVNDDGEHVDGAVTFDELMSAHEPQGRQDRPGDDLYMLYTGGTTGMPKGVMFHQADLVQGLYSAFATFGLEARMPTSTDDIKALILELHAGEPVITIACCPLMHGTAMWLSSMRALLSGGTALLLSERTFSPHEVWALAERERANEIVIVGDAFARPLLRALEEREATGNPYDTTSVRRMISSGAIWSAEIKDGLRKRISSVQLVDALGSTEAGSIGVSVATSEFGAATAKFLFAPTTKVINVDGAEVVPGSGEQGVLVTQNSAYGYYKDPVKSKATFIEIDGNSYVFTGDWASVEADGTITLLGRGSMCINTAGEKVYAEEVEEAIKRHPGIDDCLVVGLPDEQYGQRVVAVASMNSIEVTTSDEVREWLRTSLSHYKIPKTITLVDSVRRAPNGKADYKWAKETALAGDGGQT